MAIKKRLMYARARMAELIISKLEVNGEININDIRVYYYLKALDDVSNLLQHRGSINPQDVVMALRAFQFKLYTEEGATHSYENDLIHVLDSRGPRWNYNPYHISYNDCDRERRMINEEEKKDTLLNKKVDELFEEFREKTEKERL